MQRWRKNALMVLAGAFALIASPCAGKGRATNQFQVTANVISGCTVAATPMVFFVPVPANVDVSSTATLTLKCSPNVAYAIDLDAGLNPQGTTNRRVANAAKTAFLTYDIYKDPPHSQVWGRGNLKCHGEFRPERPDGIDALWSAGGQGQHDRGRLPRHNNHYRYILNRSEPASGVAVGGAPKCAQSKVDNTILTILI
ncbi:MAG: spore coat U domain-containing protein [Croceibacterium sp.]